MLNPFQKQFSRCFWREKENKDVNYELSLITIVTRNRVPSKRNVSDRRGDVSVVVLKKNVANYRAIDGGLKSF